MRKSLTLAALALLGCSGCSEGGPASDPPRTLAIDATATLHLPPDTAAITLGFSATDPDLATAHERVEESRAAFLAAVASMDLRLETGVVHYAPFRPHSDLPETFRANQTVVVHTTELDRIPAIIRLAGPGLTDVHVRHYVADMTQHRTRLRQMAIEAAGAKAGELARGFDVSLGDVLTIEERGAVPYAFGVGNLDNSIGRVEVDGDETPPPGAIPLRTTLHITYGLRG